MKHGDFIEVVRGLVRPTVVWILTGLIGAMSLMQQPITDKLWEAYFVTLVWWFATRANSNGAKP